MTVIPAKVADVPRIVVCTPPQKDGSINPLTLAAADMAGADEIYKIGGAQAIAAMALGTDSIERVDKIVGPGNVYVTAAKMLIRGSSEIDFPAGPSEVLILADRTADPGVIAADMIAQGSMIPSRSPSSSPWMISWPALWPRSWKFRWRELPALRSPG